MIVTRVLVSISRNGAIRREGGDQWRVLLLKAIANNHGKLFAMKSVVFVMRAIRSFAAGRGK